MPLLFGDFFMLVLEFLLFSASGFMILLVLVQRGRGGGLTGALGGMGGQSAFGAKAGDVFTKITVVGAAVWIGLCLITIRGYTYVPVDTTSMKEYQYYKLLGDSGDSSNVKTVRELGQNPDDGPGASLLPADSPAEEKAAQELEPADNPPADNPPAEAQPDGSGNDDQSGADPAAGNSPAGESKSGEAGTPDAGSGNAEKGAETPAADPSGSKSDDPQNSSGN